MDVDLSMIAVVDYRAGNLTSVANALSYLGHRFVVTSEPAAVARSERIVFPGVGAAGEAMRHLRELGLAPVLREAVECGKPFLGICLGYQILFEHSVENDTPCLGILPGDVVPFPSDLRDPATDRPLKVPEMGWNEAVFRGRHPVWNDVPTGSEFYFVHSYYPEPEPGAVCAKTDYGVEYASGVAVGSLVAFQFHPEKSGRPGLTLLDGFCRWAPSPC